MTDQKQPENMEYFSCFGRMITNDARCTREIKSRVAMGKTAFNKKTFFTSRLDLHLRKKLVKCCVWGVTLYGVETLLLRKVGQKCGAGEERRRAVGPIV